jgi:hypothetical protein
VRGKISARVIAGLAVMLLLAGTVVAADPSADPSASAGSSSEASSPEPSAAPSLEPSDAASLAPSESTPPLASGEPSASTEPLSSAEPSESEAPGGASSPDASEAPDKAETPEAPPTDAEIADFVSRLKAAGITTTAAEFKALAEKVGVGGAVRTLAFAQASGKTPAQIVAMKESGKGWGEIDHELGLTIGPGIGWIMSGGHSSP